MVRRSSESFQTEFESIELLRKIEPLQFYLAKSTTHSMATEFIQGGSGDNVEKKQREYRELHNLTFNQSDLMDNSLDLQSGIKSDRRCQTKNFCREWA
ncbi:hypothetical protein CEXT_471101 [Caerostris extrusa]|uniref:Uncharacterized protein n=1 Tax=Caerostris extrusa TaxID=172846 RepID=A0AAV4PZQ4_CAEEX|nr:hypothetical protein CEXT_471101 [Caerostris extrusa]